MALLQIKMYHAVADVEHSGGPREHARAQLTRTPTADHLPMLAIGASSLPPSPRVLLSPHLHDHNVLTPSRGGAPAGAAREQARGAVVAAARELARGSGVDWRTKAGTRERRRRLAGRGRKKMTSEPEDKMVFYTFTQLKIIIIFGVLC